jgi:hypothetical protein
LVRLFVRQQNFLNALPDRSAFVLFHVDKIRLSHEMAINVQGEVLNLLENSWGASFANVIQQTGFGEPGKGAPHGHEDTCFAAHA